MKKALEILREYRSLQFGWNDTEKREEISEAIAELEEAQLTRREWYQKGYAEAMKPKTCKWKNLEDDESYGWLSSCGCCYPHQKVWFQFCPICGYKVIKNEPKDNA